MKKSYVDDAADITTLDIKMAKVSEDFEGYEEINGTDNGVVGLEFKAGDWSSKYFADAALPEVDQIITLKNVPFKSGTNYVSAITATIGENAPVNFPVVKVEENGEVAYISPLGFAYDENGLIDVTGAIELADQKNVVVNLEFTYGYSESVADATFEYIGIQQKQSYTVDEVTGKLFAVAYTMTSKKEPSQYGIEIKYEDGTIDLLPAAGATITDDGTYKFAIALVDPELTTFQYRPYCLQTDNIGTDYGTYKTAIIAE